MKSLIQATAIVLSIVLLVGCSEPTLDTTSKETLKASLEAMGKDLPEEKAKKLANSVAGIYLIYGLQAAFGGKTPEEVEKTVNEQLHGKTADEIIAIGENIGKKNER